MSKIIKNKNGLTLIEVLVYLVVFSMSVVVIISFLLMINTVNSKNSIIIDVESDAQFVFDIFERKIKNSSKIISPETGEEASELTIEDDSGELKIYENEGILYIEEEGPLVYQLTKNNLIIRDLKFIVSGSDGRNIKTSFILNQRFGDSVEFKYEKKYYKSFTKY